MRDIQNSLPVSHATPGSLDSAMNDTSGRVAEADGNSCSKFVTDQRGELGGNGGLLTRPTAPQGRRSLFRR